MGCIEHNQKGRGMGYGSTRWQGVQVSLHRLAYCFVRGIEPEMLKGSTIRHTCDNPRCINPQHLLLGTTQDNIDDMVQRGRQVTPKGACSHHAKLSTTDVLSIRRQYVKRSKHSNTYTLAAAYNVTPSTIQKIVTGSTWAVE